MPENPVYRPEDFEWICPRCGAEKEDSEETLIDHYEDAHPRVLQP